MVMEAVNSVLQQTEPDIEVRVEFCERAWPEKLNDAVATLRAEWVLVLCDDDLLHPQFLEATLPLTTHADVVVTDRKVFTPAAGEQPGEGFHFRLFGEQYSGPHSYYIQIPPDSWLFGSSLPMTMLVRKTWWDKLKGHDGSVPHSDTEFWYRLVAGGARIAYVPHPLFQYRRHGAGHSQLEATGHRANVAFHRKHFANFGVVYPAMRTHALPNGTILPLGDRLAYATTHFTSLTSTGHMAIESRPLSDMAKVAIQLKQREATASINAVITMALSDAGLHPEDGWRVDPHYNAVRDVIEPPVPVDQAVTAPDGVQPDVPDLRVS